MLHIQGQFAGQAGLAMYYQRWSAEKPCKAVLGLIHGLGSHSGWFAHFAQSLAAQGYWVYGYDLRGHGRSVGQRGYINRWSEFRDDLAAFHRLIQTENPTQPIFMLGHSLGGVIALDYALHYPHGLSGLITMAPAVGPVGIAPVKLAIGQILSQVWPRFTLNSGIAPDSGSHDGAIVTAYNTDPLRHSKGTARLVTEYLATTHFIQSQLQQLTLPILILHGSSDKVALPESSRYLFKELRSEDKEYREYAGAYHDLHNDSCAPKVTQDMVNWLERQINHQPRFCKLNDSQLALA
ncbi:MAG: alpha/beta hydrolase [Leptolyngbya sp. RL_3_1]|nr:alpha/beta hydrolase [Leptolyngbya sp. RL_3_1]